MQIPQSLMLICLDFHCSSIPFFPISLLGLSSSSPSLLPLKKLLLILLLLELLEMLRSLNSHEEQDTGHQHNPSHGLSSPAHHMRQLLISCAELISQSDLASARRMVSLLSTRSSPDGDSTERLVRQFTIALSMRLNAHNFIPTDSGAIQSSYLSLNQITPFIRFSHLTANQAILEAVEGHSSIHIIDFDTMQGVQWPPLMQALAERSDPSNPPSIRITGTGHDMETLRRTGDRLQKFASSLGINFHFHPLQIPHDTSPSAAAVLRLLPSSIAILPDEVLAVNCVLYLHKLLSDDSRNVRLFLRTIKAMNPKVVTVAEREGNHNHPIFLQRFIEALDYYTAVFESLDATLPPTSKERHDVEQIWLGKEIADIVAAEGEERRERHERFESWMEIMRSSGFSNLPLSPFALSQAKLLLRLHYPSVGYQLHLLHDSFFLGWMNKPLFSVSSWY